MEYLLILVDTDRYLQVFNNINEYQKYFNEQTKKECSL